MEAFAFALVQPHVSLMAPKELAIPMESALIPAFCINNCKQLTQQKLELIYQPLNLPLSTH